MKKFKYCFTPLIWVLLSVALLIAVGTIILNISQLIIDLQKGLELNFSRIMAVIIAFLFIAFIIVVIVNSNYEITQTELKTRLGFIVTGVKLKDIKEIVLFVQDKRLSIIFKDEEFSNIVIKRLQFDDFIKQLKLVAPHIVYTPYEPPAQEENN